VLTFVLAVVPGYTCVDTGKIKSLFSGPTYAGFAATDVAERLAGSVAGTVLAVIA
jgi:Ala-tRNA(Pro) deacylase